MDKYLVDHITKYFVEEVWLLYSEDSAYNGGLCSVYRTKDAAIKAGIEITKKIYHRFCVKDCVCKCEQVCETLNYLGRLTDWEGAVTQIGLDMFVIKKEIND